MATNREEKTVKNESEREWEVLEDLRIERDRDKSVPDGDVFEFRQALDEQAMLAVSAEVVGQPYAYVEWLRVAVLAAKRALLVGKEEWR